MPDDYNLLKSSLESVKADLDTSIKDNDVLNETVQSLAMHIRSHKLEIQNLKEDCNDKLDELNNKVQSIKDELAECKRNHEAEMQALKKAYESEMHCMNDEIVHQSTMADHERDEICIQYELEKEKLIAEIQALKDRCACNPINDPFEQLRASIKNASACIENLDDHFKDQKQTVDEMNSKHEKLVQLLLS